MAQLQWNAVGERFFETGVSKGVLYKKSNTGTYPVGVAWNGITAISKSPEGAEANPFYADNIKYLNLMSAENFAGSITAYQSPIEFDECDGSASPVPGLSLGQQTRRGFGLSWQTLIGNDIESTDLGYKIHLAYDALAAPSQRDANTVNESPEPSELSWDFSTTPVEVGTLGGIKYKPTATLTIDSRYFSAPKMAELENVLYGTSGQDARLPLPAEIYSILEGSSSVVTPVKPTQVGNVVTIPAITGVTYSINGAAVSGEVDITEDVIVLARPDIGYRFPEVVDVDWLFEFEA